MTSRRYHYTVRMASWTHSKEDFGKFREWTRKSTKDFWWNHMSGDLDTFSFWAYPNVVTDLFEQQGWYPQSLSIDVGKGAIPEEER